MNINGINGGGSNAYSIADMIEQMRNRIFEKSDDDQDGKLTSEELTDLADKTGRKVGVMMDTYDTNRDGVIDTEEANKLAEDMDADMRARMHMKLFENLDQDQNGELDASELADVAEKAGLTTDELLTRYDTDGNGVITSDEAQAMAEDLRPMGPPPPPPPEEATSESSDETDNRELLDSLLEAIKGSDDAETTESLLALYTRTIIDLYNIEQTTSAASNLLNEQA